MTAETIAEVTQSEFREMLEALVEATVERTLVEMLGEPDEGLEIRSDVWSRLLCQRHDAVAWQYGQWSDEVVRQVCPQYWPGKIRFPSNSSNQSATLLDRFVRDWAQHCWVSMLASLSV